MGRCIAGCLSLMLLAAASGVSAQSREDEIVFANGVRLFGRVMQTSDGAVLVWVPGVLGGLSLASTRHESTWGPAPRTDDTVRRALGASF